MVVFSEESARKCRVYKQSNDLIFARFPHFNYNTNYPRCRVTGWTCFFVNFSVLLWFGNYRNNSRWFWQLFNFLNHTSVSGIRPNLYFRVTLPNWMNFWKNSKRPSTPTNFRKIVLEILFRKRPKKPFIKVKNLQSEWTSNEQRWPKMSWLHSDNFWLFLIISGKKDKNHKK